MSETEWSEEPAEKKSGIPKWVWIGCGGGCLLTLIVVAGISFLGMRLYRDATDPEKVWPVVEQALPFDERPEGWEVEGIGFGVGSHVTMHPPAPDGNAIVMLQYFNEREALEEQLDPDSTANNMMLVGIEDPELGEIEVQGRTIRCLRFVGPNPGSKGGLPSIRVDLTGEGDLFISFQVILPGDDPVPDDLVQRLLEPFDVWRGK